MFHEPCGTLLKPKTENGKIEMYCPTCKISIPKELLRREGTSPVVTKASNEKMGPSLIAEDKLTTTVTHTCEKCGFDKAYELLLGPTRGDEDDNAIYKCSKCLHVSRENKFGW